MGIRRVSIDKFYELVTGEKDAFCNLCKVLPFLIKDIVKNQHSLIIGKDTVIEELEERNKDLLSALYLLAFSTYEGFYNYFIVF